MKLLIIRHGDPDYERDSLTNSGMKEAKALARMLQSVNIKSIYISPLGRAQATANETLNLINNQGTTLPWLTEFTHAVKKDRPDSDSDAIAWDWFPSDWMQKEEYFSLDNWYKTPEMVAGNIKSYYDEVCNGLDTLLESAGYLRKGRMYFSENGNNDTYALFCHFGVEVVILSHLLNISPMVLWHATCARPSSITTVVTEERIKGEVSWRMVGFGEIAHLHKENLDPSFAGRFCEKFENCDERH